MYQTQQNAGIGKTNPYLSQKIMTAKPEQLISYVFDFAIVACMKKDKVKTSEALQLLVSSLRFDENKEIAMSFYTIYQNMLNRIYRQDFATAENMLREIRDSWNQAMGIH
jgi:flagellin-specific chaperone FliS